METYRFTPVLLCRNARIRTVVKTKSATTANPAAQASTHFGGDVRQRYLRRMMQTDCTWYPGRECFCCADNNQNKLNSFNVWQLLHMITHLTLVVACV